MENKKDWFKDRGYLHLTNRTSIRQRSRILKYISNPKNISSHSFSPFILKELKERKFKISKSISGVIRRSHNKFKKGKKESNVKIRPILYSTHIDAHVYSYYTKEILEPLYENIIRQNKELSNAITAYRQIKAEDLLSFKNNVHFAKDAFDEIKKRKDCIALTFDITNFFPSLNHQILKKEWANVLGKKSLPKDHYNVFKSTTSFSYIKLKDLRIINGHFDEKRIDDNRKAGKHSFFKNYNEFLESGIQIYKNQELSKFQENKLVGIPQGLPISAILANIYLLSFDTQIVEELVKQEGVFYRRYSDDIIVVCKKSQAEYVKGYLTNEIEKLELTISEAKTEEFQFKRSKDSVQVFKMENVKLIPNVPLTYLGFEFYGNKTLLKSKNLGSFYREMKQTIKRKSNRADHQKEALINEGKILYKRKIYRLYSYKGIKRRVLLKGNRKREFRGNYLKYAYRSAELMDSPQIKRQLRNHWKILQREIKKYDFDNTNNSDELN